jgi:tight adherence protein C
VVYIIALLVALTVALLVVAAAELIPARPRDVGRRLAEVRELGGDAAELRERRRRQERREQIEGLLEHFGAGLGERRADAAAIRQFLVQAGYRNPSAVAIYWGVRLFLALALTGGAFLLTTTFGARVNQIFLATILAGILGWIGPSFYVGRKRRRRIKELQQALADTLDLLVVCVEAGLGLNQALVRVSEEISHLSRAMSAEFTLVNLEIRAGVERAQALRNLADRTGVDDIRSLTAILIQTDRFGTSVATALRTQSDTMRTKRRQRAQEAAAKTTIKIVPPLVFCVFPAIFAVVLGPAIIKLVRTFAGMD